MMLITMPHPLTRLSLILVLEPINSIKKLFFYNVVGDALLKLYTMGIDRSKGQLM